MPISGPVLLSYYAVKRVLGQRSLDARAVALAPTTKADVLAIAPGLQFRGVKGVLKPDVSITADDAFAT